MGIDAVADVLVDCPREDGWLLRNDCDLGAESWDVEMADVLSTECDGGPAVFGYGGFVQGEEEGGDGRFAGTGTSHDGCARIPGNGHGDIFQNDCVWS